MSSAGICRILFIDDSAEEVFFASYRLDKGGIRVDPRTVADGPGLRKALTSWPPDLIVCPFSLHHLDGFEALEISREQAPAVPFLFRSGAIGEGRASEARRRGAYDAVDKDDYDRFLQLVSQIAEHTPAR